MAPARAFGVVGKNICDCGKGPGFCDEFFNGTPSKKPNGHIPLSKIDGAKSRFFAPLHNRSRQLLGALGFSFVVPGFTGLPLLWLLTLLRLLTLLHLHLLLIVALGHLLRLLLMLPVQLLLAFLICLLLGVALVLLFLLLLELLALLFLVRV